MFRKISSFLILSFVVISSFLSAEIEYEIQEIGTLQTHSSQAIAINNQGQILGWYNIDGSSIGKHFFVRDRDGTFHEIPNKTLDAGLTIDWQYLTNDGKAYGIFSVNQATIALCMWDKFNGFTKLGVLPGKDVVAINNAGQVLIKSISETENGKSIYRPVIWENGKITKLRGLEGDLGIESETSYGYAMNNNGEVVGESVVYICYKNNIFKQIHAVKWINGKAIDLHNTVPKTDKSCATAINDLGEVLIRTGHNTTYFISNNNLVFPAFGGITKKLNKSYICCENAIVTRKNEWTNLFNINEKIVKDKNSIWLSINKIVDVNDNGEVVVEGKTIYGEQHIIFLVPKDN